MSSIAARTRARKRGPAHSGYPSLFQITRCAQPPPSRSARSRAQLCSYGLALLLLSQCPPADAPTHTPTAPPRPNQTLSLPSTPKKVSPPRATRAPALPHPNPTHAQPHPHACSISPHQSAFGRQSRHRSCIARTSVLFSLMLGAGFKPAGGTDPAARKPYPQRRKTVGASLVGALWQRRHGWSAHPPPVLFCHAA